MSNWKKCLCFVLTAVSLNTACHAEDQYKNLPAPLRDGGRGILTTLNDRHTDRNLRADPPITKQVLSNLLWASYGVNREDGRRTVPTAMNSRSAELYVGDAYGLWLYDADNHRLILRRRGDARLGKFKHVPFMFYYAVPEGDQYGGMHVGSMYQSAALYCASIKLGNVVLGNPDVTKKADKAFKMKKKHIIAAQAFGWTSEKRIFTPDQDGPVNPRPDFERIEKDSRGTLHKVSRD